MSILVEAEVKRNDVQVKVDATVAAQAKMVAASRGVHLAEYVSELIRPLVLRDLEIEMRKQLKGGGAQSAGGQAWRRVSSRSSAGRL